MRAGKEPGAWIAYSLINYVVDFGFYSERSGDHSGVLSEIKKLC